MFASLFPALPVFPPRFWLLVFELFRELLSEERSFCGALSESRLNGAVLLEPLLKVRGLLLPELPVLPPDVLPREKPWKGEPAFPLLPLETEPSIGRATV